jgi:glycosyltransferase involved in cell wall biosynthesis
MNLQQEPSEAKGDLVSVVIPAHNEQTTLPRCLAALREQQSAREFEVIVVDSASTDRTQQVARSFGARVIRLEEPGVGRARQAGFEAARGEIILSTDADAVPSAHWIERVIAPFHDPEVIGAFGTIRFTRGGVKARISHALFSAFQGINLHVGWPLFCGPNFAVRKDAFNAVGGFSTSAGYPTEGEDTRLGLKLNKIGKIVFLRDVPMAVSPRSFEQGRGVLYVVHNAKVYFKLCWGGKGQPAAAGWYQRK